MRLLKLLHTRPAPTLHIRRRAEHRIRVSRSPHRNVTESTPRESLHVRVHVCVSVRTIPRRVWSARIYDQNAPLLNTIHATENTKASLLPEPPANMTQASSATPRKSSAVPVLTLFRFAAPSPLPAPPPVWLTLSADSGEGSLSIAEPKRGSEPSSLVQSSSPSSPPSSPCVCARIPGAKKGSERCSVESLQFSPRRLRYLYL